MVVSREMRMPRGWQPSDRAGDGCPGVGHGTTMLSVFVASGPVWVVDGNNSPEPTASR